jgi:hypothetical protein
MSNCWKCKEKRSIPGNCHVKCANPDPEMKGKKHGIVNGWFNYPRCFDPVWVDKDCSNFEEIVK